MAKIASGEWGDTVLFETAQTQSLQPSYPCQSSGTKKSFLRVGMGLIFTKHWPYKDLFDYHLMKLYEEGVLRKIAVKFQKITPESACGLGKPEPRTLKSIASLIVLWCFGLGLCVSCCLIEIFLKKFSDLPEDNSENIEGESIQVNVINRPAGFIRHPDN